MTRPFYTAPSIQDVQAEVDQILESQDSWGRTTINLIKNLAEFSECTARQIIASSITKSQVKQALAIEYECEDWNDLKNLTETMEHDDFTQISNRAKFLLRDHHNKKPVAAERLRKALPDLKRKSNRHIFDTSIALRDAQRTIAKEYGMESWAHLRKFIRSHPSTQGFLNTPGAMPPDVAEILEAVDDGDAEKVAQLIEANPSLVHARVASDITSGDTLLHRADPRATNGSRMMNRHLEVAQLLIDNGIDIDAMGGCGDSCFTPPIDASTWIGNRRMVELLLKNGADPDRRYWSMTPPVRTAANHNGKAIFRLLVKAGAKYTIYETVQMGFLKLTRELIDKQPELVNQVCGDSLPLVLAANDLKISQLLLKRGADPNLKDQRSVSPLMAAAQSGNAQVIETLLEYGGERDIFFAINNSDRDAVSRMLKEDPNCHKSKQITPLIWAVNAGDPEIVESLLKAGANPNEKQDSWMAWNPLVAAAARQQDHLIQPLLDHGAKANPPGARKWSIPLTAAVRWGTHAAVKILLDAGANPSGDIKSGMIGYPLGWAVYVGDFMAVHLLLKYGANKKARNLALIGAAQGKLALIEMLGTLDTDLDYETPQGNAIHHARAGKHADCLELLTELKEIHALPKARRETRLKPRAEFLRLVCDNDSGALDQLLAKNPELVDRDVVRNQIFHYAAGILQSNPDKKPLKEVVEVLAKHGVPWTVQSAVACGRMDKIARLMDEPLALRYGLHAAVKSNEVEMLKWFVDAGADVNFRENWGTALHEAVRYNSVDAAKVLIENGANINATDSGGSTPRASYMLGSWHRAEMRDLLDAHGARS